MGIYLKQLNDFFISHSSSDNEHAVALYNLLKSINPQWKIFLDCNDIETYDEWSSAMFGELEASKHLVFVSSDARYLKEGEGWVFEEVSNFQRLKATRNRRNASGQNISYFGVFIGKIDFEKDLFSDAEWGAEYRRIYERPEHLVLNENETIADASERIKNKILASVNRENTDSAADMLDKVKAFSKNREANDIMFSREAISDTLLPVISEGESRFKDFGEFCNILDSSNLGIIGAEGGCGKTSLLTRIFYHYLDNADLHSQDNISMVPIYIDARALAAENHLILRYIARSLYGEYTAMTEKFTGGTIANIHREFSMETKSPRYLLLIDGYNEIPVNYIKAFDKELGQYLYGGIYKNVRVVISGRYLSDNISATDFRFIHLTGLGYVRIKKYLSERNLGCPDANSALFRLLTVPMYLKMYADTSGGERINTKADLLIKFVNRQHEKDMASSNSEEYKSQSYILLYHALPLLAHRMVMTKSTKSQFAVSSDEIADIYSADTELLKSTSYKRYFGSEYRENLRNSKLGDINFYDEFDLMDISLKYFTESLKLLRKKENGEYEFVHQIYRDFFCAWFIANDIKRSSEGNINCDSIAESFMENDIKSFTAELLNETAVFFDKQNKKWDFSCNESSHLVSLLDSHRENETKNSIYAANIIELLKIVRMGNLAGCDFSNLDLSDSKLQGCCFARYDATGVHGADFKNSIINTRNIFYSNHLLSIRSAAVHNNILASVDCGGFIKLWLINGRETSHIRTIKIGYTNIVKMIFSSCGTKLYAMTSHEILEIDISCEKTENIAPRVLYKTAKRLKNILFNSKSELCFTTVFNAFNPKSVSNPDTADLCDFYGLNSCADVRHDGKQLVFGNVTCYYGLKLYNYNEDKKEWREQKIGYSYILEKYILKLEAAFKAFRMYHLFDDEDRRNLKKPQWAVRSTFFTRLQMSFEDRVHYHENVPGIVLDKIFKELSFKKVTIPKKLTAKLKEICSRYEERLMLLHEENPLLFFASCHQIYSASYKENSDIVLLSCVNKYKEKNKDIYDSIVIELNTVTHETRYITRFKAGSPLKAWYSGNSIIVSRGYRVDIYDETSGSICRIEVSPAFVTSILQPRDKECFYANSLNYIYEFNTDGICTKSFRNRFDTSVLIFCADASGNGYLAKISDARALETGKKRTVLDLTNGKYITSPGEFVTFDKPRERIVADIGSRSFKVSSNNLVVFENELKIDHTPIQYNLFVTGCDFRSVKGELAKPENQNILKKFGAFCDANDESDKAEHYTAPEAYTLQTEFCNIDAAPSVFAYKPGYELKQSNLFDKEDISVKFADLKDWHTIHWASYAKNGLEAADYSILEWINRLTFVTSKMIYDLTQASLIDMPQSYKLNPEKLAGHMLRVLHKNYKLLTRKVFCTQTEELPTCIYNLSRKYGLELLKRTEASKGFKTLSDKPFTPHEVRSMLSVNSWVCSNLNRYKDYISDYAVECVFDTDYHYCGRASLDGYIKLGSQAFFAETYRRCEGDVPTEEIRGKLERLCYLATYYKSLSRSGASELNVTKPPVIVLICEDYSHCVEINELISDICPSVRKIFTYDALVNYVSEDESVIRHFEFFGGKVYNVDIGELI